MREKIQRFMQGRYGGQDELNKFLLIITVVLFVLSLFTVRFFYIVAVILLIFSYYRMFSRNISQRYAENQKFLFLKNKIFSKFRKYKSMASQSKEYRFYKCPACHQTVRVPRGKGRIMIKCPRCTNEFIKRT